MIPLLKKKIPRICWTRMQGRMVPTIASAPSRAGHPIRSEA